MDLSVRIGSLTLKNPLIAASGCFGYGVEYADLVDLSSLGGVAVKGLFMTEREGRVSWNFLFPIFNYTTGAGGDSYRVFPLFAHSKYAGRYDRWFWLWPFFHFQRNDLSKPEAGRETRWMFWPLFGHAKRGTFESWTFLWPFFGYARERLRDGER